MVSLGARGQAPGDAPAARLKGLGLWGSAAGPQASVQEALAMEGSGSQAGEGLAVLGGAIAGMAFESVTRKVVGQATEQGVPFLLGHDTGGGDGGAMKIPFDY